MVVGRRNEVTSGTILECRVERWLPNQVAQSPNVFLHKVTQGAMTRGLYECLAARDANPLVSSIGTRMVVIGLFHHRKRQVNCVLGYDVNSIQFGKEEGKNPLRVRVLEFIEMGAKKPIGTGMLGQEKRDDVRL